MRVTLWPDATTLEDNQDMQNYLWKKEMAAFVAQAGNGELIGFLEANIRPFADGCATRNVGYIEGWFVEENFRLQGVGAALVQAAENWARSKGCREMASDCHDDSEVSLAAHLALGYAEAERLIHFHKAL